MEIDNLVSLKVRTILSTIENISKELIEYIDVLSGYDVISDNIKVRKLVVDDVKDKIQNKGGNDMFSYFFIFLKCTVVIMVDEKNEGEKNRDNQSRYCWLWENRTRCINSPIRRNSWNGMCGSYNQKNSRC